MKFTGRKAEAFVFDKRLITGIMGPVGSAKTTACIRKMVQSCFWQDPGEDGVYRAKWGVIRDTYPQLKKTVLASWHRWFPKEVGKWNGEAPFEHTVNFKVFYGGKWCRVELTVLFAAIGENKVEDVMRGWELTGLWLNEGDLLSKAVFTFGLGRIGRFPDARQCKWRGLILDMNAPDIENWTYEVFVDQDLGLGDNPELEAELREELGEQFGVGFYRQPGGRSKDPPPENMHNLPRGYYAQQMLGATKDYIRRFVDSEFGATRKGQPVFPEYNDELHCANLDHRHQKLPPIPGVPIRIATDQDLSAAAVILQRDNRGQVRILGEVVNFADSEELELEQLGAHAFGLKVARYCQDEFPDNPVADTAWCDPAALAGEKAKSADPSWRQRFAKGLSEGLGRTIKVKPAPCPGNNLEDRLDAVRKPMMRLVEGGDPGFRICPVRCKIARKAFKGMYVYARVALTGGHGRWQDKPLKNDYANVMDAIQYGCISIARGGNGDANSEWSRHPGERPPGSNVQNDSAYDVHAGR